MEGFERTGVLALDVYANDEPQLKQSWSWENEILEDHSIEYNERPPMKSAGLKVRFNYEPRAAQRPTQLSARPQLTLRHPQNRTIRTNCPVIGIQTKTLET